MSRSAYTVNPLVVVGLPTLEERPISWEWADHFQNLSYPLGARVAIQRIRNERVADARNAIVRAALDAGAQYVFFISDDVLAMPNAFALLRRHRAPMVTGVYWTKGHPTQPYLWNGLLDQGPYTDWTMGETFHIDWAGCDCLLVDTDVFRTIEPPWFSHDWTYAAGHPVPPLATEDLYFYTKARAAGIRLLCDTEVQCDHQDRATGIRYGLTKEMPQYPGARTVDPGAVLVADLGAGTDTPWFGPRAIVRRYDGDTRGRPDVRCDLRAIPEPDETFDIVHARHVLEHFMPLEAPTIVKEWARLVKVGGELRLSVPNLAYAAREILRADSGPEVNVGLYPFWQLYGRQDGSVYEVHRNGFTQHGLARLFDHCGLPGVVVTVTGDYGENLTATWRKTTSLAPYTIQDKWQAIETAEATERDHLADLPVPPIPAARINGARELVAADMARTKASED